MRLQLALTDRDTTLTQHNPDRLAGKFIENEDIMRRC